MKVIYTIGHSTRTFEQLLELLRAYGIEKVVDIRTIAKSRHNPQFNQTELRTALKNRGIAYEHLKKLGGLRHAKKDSINQGWHNASFRGYADYMVTADFEQGLQSLEDIAQKKVTVIMCAEAVSWRCHRSLVADALKLHGWQVLHIMSKRSAREHDFTPFMQVHDGKITYPEEE